MEIARDSTVVPVLPTEHLESQVDQTAAEPMIVEQPAVESDREGAVVSQPAVMADSLESAGADRGDGTEGVEMGKHFGLAEIGASSQPSNGRTN